jgi:hypothetical protein
MVEERGIRKLPTAAYEVRVHVSRDPVTGKIRQLSRTVTGTLAAARKARAKLITEVAEGKHGGTSTTFGALLDRCLEHREKVGASSHHTRRRSGVIERVIRPAIGSVRLDKLTARHLDSLYASHQGPLGAPLPPARSRGARAGLPLGLGRCERGQARAQAPSPRWRSSGPASTSSASSSPLPELAAGRDLAQIISGPR